MPRRNRTGPNPRDTVRRTDRDRDRVAAFRHLIARELRAALLQTYVDLRFEIPDWFVTGAPVPRIRPLWPNGWALGWTEVTSWPTGVHRGSIPRARRPRAERRQANGKTDAG